jgi:hypothetical protein
MEHLPTTELVIHNGIPVWLIQGWGVLVLDSTCDTTPNMKAAKTFAKYFRLFISSVTPLLEAL